MYSPVIMYSLCYPPSCPITVGNFDGNSFGYLLAPIAFTLDYAIYSYYASLPALLPYYCRKLYIKVSGYKIL